MVFLQDELVLNEKKSLAYAVFFLLLYKYLLTFN